MWVGNNPMEIEAMINVFMYFQDRKKEMIENVFYILDLNYKLMIFGQVVEKRYSVIMEDDSLKLYDSKRKLLLKSPLSKNRTVNTLINVVEDDFLASIIYKETILWNKR